MNICVFCGSNPAIGEPFTTVAWDVGTLIGEGGHALVFGGFELGLMGEVARAARAAGGQVVGVFPATLRVARPDAAFACDEAYDTADLAQRKRVMMEHSDAYIVLPGAYGTLDELYEVLSQQRAGERAPKPVALVNVDGFYDGLREAHRVMLEHGFMSQREFDGVLFAETAEEALAWVTR